MSKPGSYGLAPLRTNEYDKLLRQWGFEPIDHGGNHPMYLAPNGITRFPISTAGKVTQRELRQAAKLVGASRRAFLAGPPKSRPIRTVQVDPDELIRKAQAEMDELAVIAEQRAKEKQMAKVVEQPKRPYTKGMSERVHRYVKDHPDQELTTGAVGKALGANRTSGTVSMALQNMASRDPQMTRLGTGRYIYQSERTHKPEQGPRNGNLRNEILRLMEDNEGRPMSIELVVEKLGSVKSSTANALLSLSRIGAIRQLARGIYQFDSPPQTGGFVSDETQGGSTHPDDQPINLYPTTLDRIEDQVPTMWEEMKGLGDGRFLLRDENGELWVAKMQRLELI